jgi:hypothetical protein
LKSGEFLLLHLSVSATAMKSRYDEMVLQRNSLDGTGFARQ